MSAYQNIIDDMPVGLERAIGRLLSSRVGIENKLERGEMLNILRSQSWIGKVTDRQMRIAIQSLRGKGLRICHAESREDIDGKKQVVYGYYLAANDLEYYDFRNQYMSYANTIFNNVRAMDARRSVTLSDDGDVVPLPGIEVQGALFLS